MAVEEKIVVSMNADAGSFLIVLDRAIAKIRRLEDSFNRFTQKTKTVTSGYSAMARGIIGDQKSLGASFQNIYGKMQEQLKPLGEEVKNAMNKGFIEPSLNAKQSVQGILDKQKDLGNTFKDSYGALEAQLKPLSENVRGALIKGFVQPSLTAAQATQGILDKQKDLAQFSAQMKQKWEAQGRIVNDTSKGFRMFRMEMLSVMFGGQMLQSAMFGLLKPAMQVAGIFDILTATLQVLFLPIALFLLENVFLPMMDFFTGLDPTLQMIIGGFVLFAGILGSILAVGGALILFFDGIVMALGSMGIVLPTFSAIGAALSGIALIAGVVLAVVIALVIGFVTAWRTNFGGMREVVATWWEAVKGVWQSLKKIVGGIIEFITGLFTGNFDKMWAGAKTVFSGLFGLFKNLGIMAFKSLSILAISVLSFFKTIWTGLFNLLKGILDVVLDFLIKKAKDWGFDWAVKFLEGLKSIKDKIIDFFTGIISTVLGGIAGFIGGIGGGKDKPLSSKQSGGFIPHTGLYKLHEGETVVPAGQTFSPTINVSASSNVDIDMLKTQLSSQWNDDFSRLSRG